METSAIILNGPRDISHGTLGLTDPGPTDLVVEIDWSGISTGTEKLFWTGEMPPFPGMGYPLVPGYEAAGEVVEAGSDTPFRAGDRVFVPGSACSEGALGLFGGAAARVVTDAARVARIDSTLGPEGALLALAVAARAPAPVVWDTDPARREGAIGYEVLDPADDTRHDYASVYDASGAKGILDTAITRIARGGEVVLAGFYPEPINFAFPPAFMKEARIRVAAEWTRDDLAATRSLIEAGALSLAGLVTHVADPSEARAAYETAFDDPDCLKMILDWKGHA